MPDDEEDKSLILNELSNRSSLEGGSLIENNKKLNNFDIKKYISFKLEEFI